MAIKVRSKFEKDTVAKLEKAGVKFKYESMHIKYLLPARIYTPDIALENGIIVELKGYFRPADRQLHRAIKEQYPELDLRFVFMNANNRIHSSSKTTYGDWCDKYGFKYASKEIPDSWLKEKKKK